MSKRVAIVRGQYGRNQSKQGGRSYQRVKGMANYLAFGKRENGLYVGKEMRGQWYGQNGRSHSHQAVLEWAREKVHRFEYDYNYNLLLSTRHGHLTKDDFNQVLEQGSEISDILEWRFVVHDDTNYQHAHAILFCQEKMQPELYKEWQQAMQQGLSTIQHERYLEWRLQQELAQQQGQLLEQELQLGLEIAPGQGKKSGQKAEEELRREEEEELAQQQAQELAEIQEAQQLSQGFDFSL